MGLSLAVHGVSLVTSTLGAEKYRSLSQQLPLALLLYVTLPGQFPAYDEFMFQFEIFLASPSDWKNSVRTLSGKDLHATSRWICNLSSLTATRNQHAGQESTNKQKIPQKPHFLISIDYSRFDRRARLQPGNLFSHFPPSRSHRILSGNVGWYAK